MLARGKAGEEIAGELDPRHHRISNDVAYRVFLDRREPASNVSFGGLRLGEVVCLVFVDKVVILAPHLHKLCGDKIVFLKL